MGETREQAIKRIESETLRLWVCIGCSRQIPEVTFRNSSLFGTGHIGGVNAFPVCDTCWKKK